MNFEKDRKKYIEKLQNSKKAIDYILHIKNKFLKFSDSDIETETTRFKTQIDRYIDKLQKNKFEVAIVGLEKAGKSTFANSLMKSNFLPEAKQRCTFTTTIVESSKKDIAEIEFFSKEEFVTKFNDLLSYIDFSGAKFDSLTITDIENHLNTLAEKDERRYEEVSRSDTLDDIISIVERKDALSKYLGREKLTIEDKNLKDLIKNYITVEEIARAVKEISIKSSNLKALENLILYDVPGFDSPTKLHKKQAIDKMIEADAILFVVSIADRVSFVKSQVDVLNQAKDEYGQSLSDKMIIFGNKIDVHTTFSENGIDKKTSLKEIDEYKNLLKNELVKYKIYNENNIFFGSPLAYLESNGVINSKSSLNKMKALALPSGIEDILERLNEFFNVDRFNILVNILNKLISDIKRFLILFLQKNRIDATEQSLTGELLNFVDEFWLPRRDNLIQKLNELSNDLNSQNYNIDKLISDKISQQWIKSLIIDDALINKHHNKLASGSIKIEQPEKVNVNIRDELYKKSINGFIDICSKITIEKNREIQNRIKDLIESIIFQNRALPSLQSSKNRLKLEIQALIEDFTYDKKSYTPLISRFANDILEILILNPITDKFEGTRINKFLKSQKNIESITIFDETYKENLNLFEQDLVKRLLIQETSNCDDIKKRLDILGEFFDDKKDFEKFKNDLAKTIKDKNLSVKKVIKNIKQSPKNLKDMEKLNSLKNFVDSSLPNELERLISNANIALSYKDVKDEINEDINSLEFIINQIILKAVKIEEPFKHSIEYQIQSIKNDLESGKRIKSFINQNIDKIEGERFTQIENRYKQSEEFNEVIKICEEVIDKL